MRGFQGQLRTTNIPWTVLKSLQGAVQGRKPLLSDRDSWLSSRRIPVPLGQWWEVRLFSRGPWCRTKALLAIPNDLEHHQKPVRAHYRRHCQHHCAVHHWRYGKTPGRFRLNMGRLWIDLRAWADANWGRRKTFHHRGYWNRQRLVVNRAEGEGKGASSGRNTGVQREASEAHHYFR